MSLTIDRLKEVLSYDPETGVFTHISPRKKIRVGEVSGHLDSSNGYITLRIDKKKYYGHRAAFLYMTGNWPNNVVDHIDGNRSNNKWENLRDVTRTVNQQNIKKAPASSLSGKLGAFKKKNRWASSIKSSGKVVRLGSFSTPEEAHAAYVSAKRNLHEGCTI